MLDFRHETFLLLCEIRSYTKTAEYIGITQPAVSQHIKYLEEIYGGKLFSHEGKKLTLTERGKRLYKFALTVRADGSHLKRSLIDLTTQRENISFGATLSIGEYVMPPIIAEILKDNLGAIIHMQVNNTQTLLEKLHKGEFHFALLEGYFDKSDYAWELFSQEEFIAVCGPHSQFANQEVRLADILNQRLFIRENGSGTREIFEQILCEHNYTIESFNDVCIIGNMNALKELVHHNLGITFLYKVVAEQDIAMGKLKRINIRDFTVWRAFHFVFLKNSQHQEEYLEWYRYFLRAREAYK